MLACCGTDPKVSVANGQAPAAIGRVLRRVGVGKPASGKLQCDRNTVCRVDRHHGAVTPGVLFSPGWCQYTPIRRTLATWLLTAAAANSSLLPW